MKCEEAKYVMIEALGGEALLRERLFLGLHCMRCSDCRSEWKELKRLKRLIVGLREKPPFDLEEVLGAYKAKRPLSRRLVFSLATAGGIAALLLFKGSLLEDRKGLLTEEGEVAEVMDSVILSYAEKAYAMLPLYLEEEGSF